MVPRAFQRGAPLRPVPRAIAGRLGRPAVSIGCVMSPLCHESSMAATCDEKMPIRVGVGKS
ncbi:hypothetical protein JCM18916_2372 [Cutibacterium acnes JCM 18916]|nr:hypothetical protein JCM18916_2372 [Cutibacterium acnes JCM 18916]GAE76440.1 hypothetical protein JCM18918_2234 [Cutibacterium acnes JCM 18918]